ncbi:hypothetical protein OUZ56_012574 [Daphnia magna]|uniref:HAT C-terminal dimerisation domain-containing protein n=1 Tax=Daphnia magna TaxID=35525 RepID=A0ABQ9Z3E0_9CRUS|nr:hypothetical protein OUZ56_012574 [Daphnia magna]
MEKLKHNSEVKHCKSIVNNLINSVKKRFAECFDDEELKIAAISLKKKKVCTEANEVELFLADESTETSSLENYPTLKKMYMKYNAALPSSASVERLFSARGLILIPTRANHSDENFEKLLFLKVNKFE